MLDRDWANARNILAVRLDNIGDIIMLGPSLRTIKDNLPDCQITLLASPAGTQAVPLLWPVDRVITWRPVWQDVGNMMPVDPARELQLVEAIAEADFDAAIVFTSFSQSPWPPAYMCYLAEIPLRLGQSKEFGGSLLTTWIKAPDDAMHQVDRNLYLLERAGFVISNRALFASISESARESIDLKLASKGIEPGEPFILVHPGATCSARTYPFARWSSVVLNLVSYSGLPVVISGNEKDARRLKQSGPSAWNGSVILAGQTTVEQYASLIGRAAIVLTGNTSAMHLADAVGKPSVILFSGTDLECQWRPRNTPSRTLRRETPCMPCYLFTCPFSLQCLDIEPEEVVEAALDLLNKRRVAREG
ncbi:MAG: glycosyltransferase family 9 protein [Chloroflexi bacterium]|nr:glycosyltransferase family 9 protein [Chloroflexota bacterium]